MGLEFATFSINILIIIITVNTSTRNLYLVQISLFSVLKRISVSLDTDTHKALKVFAAANDTTISDVAWEAIRQYLQRECKNGSESS